MYARTKRFPAENGDAGVAAPNIYESVALSRGCKSLRGKI